MRLTLRSTRREMWPILRIKIARYKDYTWHCFTDGNDFGLLMIPSMRKDSEKWQKELRGQDPAITSRPEYYTKETLRWFQIWLKEKCPTVRVFVSHSKWQSSLSDFGRSKKNTIKGFYAHMIDVLKELLQFDSVREQFHKENIVNTKSLQYKVLKGRHISISHSYNCAILVEQDAYISKYLEKRGR